MITKGIGGSVYHSFLEHETDKQSPSSVATLPTNATNNFCAVRNNLFDALSESLLQRAGGSEFIAVRCPVVVDKLVALTELFG